VDVDGTLGRHQPLTRPDQQWVARLSAQLPS
jgi:hypothetical protein